MPDILAAALTYARDEGWAVFPVPPGMKKSYKSAARSGGAKWGKTREPDEITRDWERWPDANVGIPTGAENGFWVVELDTPVGHAVDGPASMRDLEAIHGPLPLTRMAMSPSGSIHYYWLWPADANIKNSTSRIGPGIDVRAEGGMVVGPPSVRRDGEYRWLNDAPMVEAPKWLVEAAVAASASHRARANGAAREGMEVDYDKIRDALAAIPNDDLDWESWNHVAMMVYAATGGTNEGYSLFDAWSKKSDKYDADGTRAKWNALHGTPPTDLTVGSLYYRATEACPGWDRVSITDFYAYMPMHNYIFKSTRDHWPPAAVDARLPAVEVTNAEGEVKLIKPHVWLDHHRPVDQMTWCPGKPQLIKDRVVAEGGWIEHRGVVTYNLYRPPNIKHGDPALAGPWLDHVDILLGAEGRQHIIPWLAHRVQRPHEKINHALVLGGAPGIGKDTLLEPVKRAVGSWNFSEVSPQQLIGRFNPFLKAVVMRVSEARDLGEVNRYQFYEHMKTYTAAPPDTLTIDEKHINAYSIFNVVGVIITTNYKHEGIFLPADDRRHYVHWTDLTRDDFDTPYWNDIWGWYDDGGYEHVAAYLMNLDISRFDPKAPPPKTQAFWAIVDANRAPEDAELADAIEEIGSPNALTVLQLINRQGIDISLFQWMSDRRNRRRIPHRLEQCGYVPVRNTDAQDGLWKVDGKRQVVYAKTRLVPRDQVAAAQKCVNDLNSPQEH